MLNIINTTEEQLFNSITADEESYENDFEEYMIDVPCSDDKILVVNRFYKLHDVGVIIAEGVYCSYDEDTDDLMPDWGCTLIYNTIDAAHLDLNDYTYFEQDPPYIALHNYKTMTARTAAKTKVVKKLSHLKKVYKNIPAVAAM